jgi:hypothetical protein
LSIARFREDLKGPLPGTEEWPRRRRLGFRLRHLLRTYGWKLVFVFVLYYLFRDLLLYVVLPLLIAEAVIG